MYIYFCWIILFFYNVLKFFSFKYCYSTNKQVYESLCYIFVNVMMLLNNKYYEKVIGLPLCNKFKCSNGFDDIYSFFLIIV